MRRKNKERGFSIVELMIVIAVIAILSSIILVLFDSVRVGARDSKRISDLNNINKALNLYYANNGVFPIAQTAVTLTGSDTVSLELKSDQVIPQVPPDPLHPTYTYEYQTDAFGTTFVLRFCLETNDIENYSSGCDNEITP